MPSRARNRITAEPLLTNLGTHRSDINGELLYYGDHVLIDTGAYEGRTFKVERYKDGTPGLSDFSKGKLHKSTGNWVARLVTDGHKLTKEEVRQHYAEFGMKENE